MDGTVDSRRVTVVVWIVALSLLAINVVAVVADALIGAR